MPEEVLRDLGKGLVLRRATTADAEALVAFNAQMHTESGQQDERIAAWTRDLMVQPHPTFQVGDFTLVEEKTSGKIISTLNLIPQTWTYGGIPFRVGRPELVGTLAEYRNRGLVRAQFEVIHQWCAERGYLIQAITGIPYYYRLFGYEMGLELSGGRAGYKPQIPRLKEGESEPYCIRPAEEADLPLIAELYALGAQRSLVACAWDEALWRYELLGKSEKNVNRWELCIIETPEHAPVGFLAHPFHLWGSMMAATAYELKPGVSLAAVTPSVIRYLQKTGEAYQVDSQGETFESFGFWMGTSHPVYELLGDNLPRQRRPYAWYVRVPNLPGFLRHIAPVLEKRLAESAFAGHSGELKLTFYRSGLRLVFEQGRLATCETWQPEPVGGSGDAGFPNLTFLQLLFGYRSLDELRYAFADCWASNQNVHALLESLFPKASSSVWAVA